MAQIAQMASKGSALMNFTFPLSERLFFHFFFHEKNGSV